MEKFAFIRLLDRLLEEGVKIKVISTDRHTQIRKYLKDHRDSIKHEVDLWHVIKGLIKKIMALSKKKKFRELGMCRFNLIPRAFLKDCVCYLDKWVFK